MKTLIVGTNRPQSNSLKVGRLISELYQEQGEKIEVIELEKIPMELLSGQHYGKEVPEPIQSVLTQIQKSEGLIVVVPEYNGSVPGALKYFIDFWKYPDSFEHRPVCFVGLGGLFGGLRPVEHLQQVFGYRNAFIYPDRVFLMNVWKLITPEGKMTDALMVDLLKKQVIGFQKFCRALKSENLIP